jgi:hypothetical protein
MKPIRSIRMVLSGPTRLSAMMLAVVLAVAWSPLIHAADNVSTMAGIVLSLQHFPSDADKAALAAIAGGDASAAEKTIAETIAGIQHKASAEGMAALEAIAADESQPGDVRELAAIVAGINHVPSAEAKAALTELAGG